MATQKQIMTTQQVRNATLQARNCNAKNAMATQKQIIATQQVRNAILQAQNCIKTLSI